MGAIVIHVRQCSESIALQFKDVVGVVKCVTSKLRLKRSLKLQSHFRVTDAAARSVLSGNETSTAERLAVPKRWPHLTNGRQNEAAERRTLARDTIWQGNCDGSP